MSSPAGQRIAATIASSDSGGGAGVQADLKSFAAMGVFGVSVTVALTAQNTVGVSSVHAVPIPFVQAQFEALDADLRPQAVKTGMLYSADAITLVADLLSRSAWGPLVVDPVMVAKSGDRLLQSQAVEVMRARLIPLAEVLTPNWPEAEVLAGFPVTSERDAERAGERLREMGAANVVVKGGHSPGEPVDLLLTPSGVVRFPGHRVVTRHTHGTGCTFSAAIAALLAKGMPVPEAVAGAKRYLQMAIEQAPGLGTGHGPLEHFPSRGMARA